ncbi:MAG TPA: NAD(P)H-dependent oxidoreductase [Terriglobia bacterium]|nr:NAD(P)H-dependent oxidoreductase [Terriglobia bacterium]
MSSGDIRIVVINGSVRPGNYTAMASALVVDELRKQSDISVETIEPGSLHLPFPGTDPGAPGTQLLQQKVAAATGVVLATPEYHGSFSSVMKLVIENLGFPSVLAGKPVALLGVAAGSIGAIKSLEHLRGVISHIGAMALPMPVSVSNVQKVFDAEGNCLDPQIEKLIRRVGNNLLGYVRENLCPRFTLEKLLRNGVSALLSDQ